MKRLALVAAVLVLAACSSKKDETATADTAAPAMAPAPMDTGMKMTTVDTAAGMAKDTVTKTTTTSKTTKTPVKKK